MSLYCIPVVVVVAEDALAANTPPVDIPPAVVAAVELDDAAPAAPVESDSAAAAASISFVPRPTAP